MHPVVTTIRSLLEGNDIPYQYMEHEPGTSSEDMAAIRKDFSLSEGAKALILAADSCFIQVVIPGDRKFSNSKLKKITGVRNIRFAAARELAEITGGILPGAVPPFGTLFHIPVYADERLFVNERIVFNCGERTASIAMRSDDYRDIVRPKVVAIAE